MSRSLHLAPKAIKSFLDKISSFKNFTALVAEHVLGKQNPLIVTTPFVRKKLALK